jgi:hypothetical protein
MMQEYKNPLCLRMLEVRVKISRNQDAGTQAAVDNGARNCYCNGELSAACCPRASFLAAFEETEQRHQLPWTV